MDDVELATVTQAAKALGASSQTIRNWIRAGRLQALRIGHRFLIPRTEVERFRGDLSPPRGEGPWDFALDEPGAPLPRPPERTTGGDVAQSSLGG